MGTGLKLMNELSSKLRDLGIEPGNLEVFQIICLPENVFTFSSPSEVYEPAEATDLVKRLKERGLRSASLYELGFEASTLSRRSDEKWLGVIWVRDKVAIPVLTGVLSALIATAITNASQKSDSGKSIEIAKDKVHVELYIENGEDVTSLKYKGDGENLLRVLEALQEK